MLSAVRPRSRAATVFCTLPLPPNSATNLPPGFSARAIPSTTWSACGIQCNAALENTPSNSCMKSKSLASQTSNLTSGNFCRASATISGERSTPTTRAPLVAISAERWPVPQPTSRIRSPLCAASHSSRQRAFSQTKACLVSYSSASHLAEPMFAIIRRSVPGRAGIDVLSHHSRQNLGAPDDGVLHRGLVDSLKALQLWSSKQHDVLIELLVRQIAVDHQEFNMRAFSGGRQDLLAYGRKLVVIRGFPAESHVERNNDVGICVRSEVRLVNRFLHGVNEGLASFCGRMLLQRSRVTIHRRRRVRTVKLILKAANFCGQRGAQLLYGCRKGFRLTVASHASQNFLINGFGVKRLLHYFEDAI